MRCRTEVIVKLTKRQAEMLRDDAWATADGNPGTQQGRESEQIEARFTRALWDHHQATLNPVELPDGQLERKIRAIILAGYKRGYSAGLQQGQKDYEREVLSGKCKDCPRTPKGILHASEVKKP